MHTRSCGLVLTFVAEWGEKFQYTVRVAHLDPNRIVPQPTRRSVPSSGTFLLEESGRLTPLGGGQDAAAIGPREREAGRDAGIMLLRIPDKGKYLACTETIEVVVFLLNNPHLLSKEYYVRILLL